MLIVFLVLIVIYAMLITGVVAAIVVLSRRLPEAQWPRLLWGLPVALVVFPVLLSLISFPLSSTTSFTSWRRSYTSSFERPALVEDPWNAALVSGLVTIGFVGLGVLLVTRIQAVRQRYRTRIR